MHSNLTRPQLAALENELAFFSGRVKEWKRSTDYDDLLLTGVELRRWDGNSPINSDSTPDATVDHLWIRCTRGKVKVERWARTCGIGRISYYTRSDGTYDLGIQSLPSICLEDLNEEAWSCFQDRFRYGLEPVRKAILTLKVAVTYAYYQGEKGYAYSYNHTLPEAVKILLSIIKRLERDVEAQQSRLDAQAHLRRGPCRGLDLTKAKGQVRAKAAGF